MDQESIERYLAKNMTPEEIRGFELAMDQDPQLKKEVEELEKAIEALRIHERSALKSRLKQRDQKLFESNSVNKPNRLIWYLLAVLIILSLIWIWTLRTKNSSEDIQNGIPAITSDSIGKSTPNLNVQDSLQSREPVSPLDSGLHKKESIQNPEELFAMHFVPYTDELLESEIRGDDEEKTAFEQFQMLYAQKKYDEAIKAFELLDPVMKKNDNVLFLKANALMATHKIEMASSLLKTIVKHKESRYLKDAYWYLALCEVKNGNIDKARFYLQNPLIHSSKRSKSLLEKI